MAAPDIGRTDLLTILTDSAAQVDRASPVDASGEPHWRSPDADWWDAFIDTVAMQVAEQTK